MENLSINSPKVRSYQTGELVLTEEEFQEVVDVFRILLKWDRELNQSGEKQET